MLELTKFNGFFKSDFDVFLERNEYGIYCINDKLKTFSELLYKNHPNLNNIIPKKKQGRIHNMESVSTFMWKPIKKSKEKHYSVPHFFMCINYKIFCIHLCFEAVDISRKFVKVLKNDLNKRSEFIDILEKCEGYMIEIDKVDFMRIESPDNHYTTLVHMWLNKDWAINDIVEFIYTQMEKINNLSRGKFITKKACFYLRKYIYRNNPILKTSKLVDDVYQIIQEFLPMYNFLLGII